MYVCMYALLYVHVSNERALNELYQAIDSSGVILRPGGQIGRQASTVINSA